MARPWTGDGVQAIKSGLLEVGDIVVINKADQPGAEDASDPGRRSTSAHPIDGRKFRSCRQLASPVRHIWSCSPRLTTTMRGFARAASEPAAERGARAEVLSGLRAALDRRLESGPVRSPELAALIAASRAYLSPWRAVNALTVALDSPASGGSIGD